MGSDPQIPLADGNKDSRLSDGVGIKIVELHAVVVRERPHEPVRRDTEAALVEGDEAHDVAVAGPQLRLTVRSNSLRPTRVCHRAEQSTVDKRLEHLLGDVRRIPGVRLDDNDITGPRCARGIRCGGESFLSLPRSHLFLASSLGSLFLLSFSALAALATARRGRR